MKLTLVNKARAKVDARWLKRFVEDLAHTLRKRRVFSAEAFGKRHFRGRRKGSGQSSYSYELTIVFVTQTEMRRLNKHYRGKDYATDVLSFEGEPAAGGDSAQAGFIDDLAQSGEFKALGELVLCAPVLRRQAREHHLSFEQELAYMIIHGVLHLLGYEHEKGGRDARLMYKLQDDLFRELVG